MAFYAAPKGLRGSFFEELINGSNEIYRREGLALVQKLATPITPVTLDKKTGRISLAYFDEKSTVDYMGVVQGIPVAFDAKETKEKSLPLANIREHQIRFMQDFSRQDGLAFLLVFFTALDRMYLLPFEDLVVFRSAAGEGGRKSVPLDAFSERYRIKPEGTVPVHYLPAVAEYLEARKAILK